MKFNNVYIQEWSYYVPDRVVDIQALYPNKSKSLGINKKHIAANDEDSLTMSIECLLKLDYSDVDSLFIGSESHPYAVKPQITTISSILGLKSSLTGYDLQFACRGGIDSVITSSSYVGSGASIKSIAIGSDVAQAEAGDVLELSAASGASAWLISNNKKKSIFKINSFFSNIEDIPDFWRHNQSNHPQHAGRYTGEPAYFDQLQKVFNKYLNLSGNKIENIKKVVIHSPNTKFPLKFASYNQISQNQLGTPLSVNYGNPYSANVMIQAILRSKHMRTGDILLILSYGSGAGSIALELIKT